MSTYNVSSEQAFAAVMKAVADSGFGLRQSNPPSFLEVQTRNRYKAWDGVISVIITDEGKGCSVSMNPTVARMDFGKIGYMAVAEAKGASQMAINKLQRHIESRIMEVKTSKIQKAGETKPKDSKSSNTADVVEQLLKLKELLDAGAISEAEFNGLKKKLMG